MMLVRSVCTIEARAGWSQSRLYAASQSARVSSSGPGPGTLTAPA